MCRKTKFASLAYTQALQSDMNFKHGAIITKGSKVMASAMNHNRTQILGQTHSSVHAEIAVASKLINQFIRKKTQNKYLVIFMLGKLQVKRELSRSCKAG